MNEIPETESRLYYVRTGLIWFAYILACVMEYLSWHVTEAVQPLRYLIAGAVLLSFDYDKWDKFKIFLAVFLLAALVARRLLTIWTIMALVYQIDALKIPVKRIALAGACIMGALVILQITLFAYNVFEGYERRYSKLSRMVYDLGTGNANRFSALVYFFFMLLYLNFKEGYRTAYVVWSLIIGYFVFYLTGSRTPFLGIIVLNIVAIADWFGLLKNWTKWAFAFLPAFFLVMTFMLAANIDDNLDVNTLASGRLYYIVMFTIDFTPLDWLVGTVREFDEPLDSTYLDLIIKGGILLATFVCVGFAMSVIKCFDKVKPYLPLAVSCSASGLAETFYTDPNSVSVIFWMVILMWYIKPKPVFGSPDETEEEESTDHFITDSRL